MNTIKFVTLLGTAILTLNSYALSPEAVEGKALFPACDVCHNQATDPPLGPPMWGVKRQYQKNTMDAEDFVETMVDFVKAPSEDKVIHKEAFSQLGLMPPMPLPFQNRIPCRDSSLRCPHRQQHSPNGYGAATEQHSPQLSWC